MTFKRTFIQCYPNKHESLKGCLWYNNYFAKVPWRTVPPSWWTFGYSDRFRQYGHHSWRRSTPDDRRREFIKHKNKPKKIK